MSAKLYEEIGYLGIIRLLLFLAKVLKILWHFEILTWESTGKRKMWISRKRMIVKRIRQKFRTRGPTVHTCRVLLMPDSLSLSWGHSVLFAKFPILRSSKHYSNSLHQNSSKLHSNYHNQGLIQAVIFLGDLPKNKKNMALWNFC